MKTANWDMFLMGVGHRLTDLLEHLEEEGLVVGRVGTFLEKIGQGAALDQLHGEERATIGQDAQLIAPADERGIGRDGGHALSIAQSPDQVSVPGFQWQVQWPHGCTGPARRRRPCRGRCR